MAASELIRTNPINPTLKFQSMASAPANITAQNNPEPTSDDVSLYLQQIILRRRRQPFEALPDLGPGGVYSDSGRFSVPDPNYAPMTSSNGSSARIGRLEGEADDDYDYESEEVAEAVVEEMAAKAPPPRRPSSKRSRTAEVHNQSEKRRRRRINEKMKALQNLIPNSNKSDKASMLDDAIEYLKQLQLQVQMLTMKNLLSVHPTGVSGMLLQQPNDQYTSQMRVDENFILNSNHKPSGANPMESVYMDHQNISADPLIRLQDKCTNNNQVPTRVTDFQCMVAPKTSVKVESEPTVAHFSTYQRPDFSKEKVWISQPLNEDCLQTSSTGKRATSSIPCETNTSKMKDSTLEACLAGGDDLLQNFVNHPMFSSHLSM